MKPMRITVAALGLSAVGFAALVAHESYVPEAMVPTKGDRPTVGFGSTYRDDGTPVQLGDTITVPKAVERTLAHVAKDETGLKRCITAPLSQTEFDLLVNHAYQYGVARTCASDVVKLSNAGQYRAACDAYLNWYRAGGRDCRHPSSWGPMGCKGVWVRSIERQQKCIAAQ